MKLFLLLIVGCAFGVERYHYKNEGRIKSVYRDPNETFVAKSQDKSIAAYRYSSKHPPMGLAEGLGVVFVESFSQSDIDKWIRDKKLKHIRTLDLGKKKVYHFQTPGGDVPLKTAQQWSNLAFIESIYPNWIMSVTTK